MQIRGLGDESPRGWVLEHFELPLPKGISNILNTIRDVLTLGQVQTLQIDIGCPLRYSRLVRETEAQQKQQEEREGAASLGSIARNIFMEEYSGTRLHGGPTEILFDMFLGISARQLYLTHIGIGVASQFFDWMSMDPIAYGGIDRLGGAQLVRDSDIPDNTLIMFAGPYAAGQADQATYALTCRMIFPGGDRE